MLSLKLVHFGNGTLHLSINHLSILLSHELLDLSVLLSGYLRRIVHLSGSIYDAMNELISGRSQ